MLAARILLLARTRRCAIVGSGDEEGAGDLARLQPAEQPQGQRHLRARRQRRVAAGEDQAESVVVIGSTSIRRLVAVEQRGLA